MSITQNNRYYSVGGKLSMDTNKMPKKIYMTSPDLAKFVKKFLVISVYSVLTLSTLLVSGKSAILVL